MEKILLLFMLLLPLKIYSQRTNNPPVTSQSNSDYKIEYVDITDEQTIVGISFQGSGGWFVSLTISISPNTILSTQDDKLIYKYPIRALSDGMKTMQLGTQYSCPGNKDTYHLQLIFDKIPSGCTTLDIDENATNGWHWNGVKINNPICISPHKNLSEEELVGIIAKSNDGICGFYEGINEPGSKLACIKENGEYSLIYLGGKSITQRWNLGDVKAELRPSANAGLFKASWYMDDKKKFDDAYVAFDGASMKTNVLGIETHYLKMYTSSYGSSYNDGVLPKGEKWSGTGFALLNNYLVTNFHVVNNAKSIVIHGVNGNLTSGYKASVVATDVQNDLALLRIEGVNINNATIPYATKTTISDVGEEVFVLGYPLTSSMGNEIKLTTGVISSKSGLNGDISMYQISAPVHPGNSGGPLFDSKGNVIGIVFSKHREAENVSYAIKVSYLRNLIESTISTNILPQNNKISGQKLSNKVKAVKDFIYYITCSN